MFKNLFGRSVSKRVNSGRQNFARLRMTEFEDRIVPNTYWVDVNGGCDATALQGNPNRGTEGDPFKSIQAAVDQALNDDTTSTPDTINVATGTYQYTSAQANPNFAAAGVTAVVEVFPAFGVVHGLIIQGGFPHQFTSGPNPQANPTIIDGGGTNRGVYATGLNESAGGGPYVALTMNGFTVQHGYGGPVSDPVGADLAYPAMQYGDNDFTQTGAGGGMLVMETSLSLQNMTFDSNSAVGASTGPGTSNTGGYATGGGLAIFRAGPSTTLPPPPTDLGVTLNQVSFTNNFAQGGYASASPPSPDNPNYSYGGFAVGGGLVIVGNQNPANPSQEETLTVSSGNGWNFSGNVAESGGTNGSGQGPGGENGNPGTTADALGGGATFEGGSNITVSNLTAYGNTAQGGNVVDGQSGAAFGGGIYVADGANVNITTASLTNNLALGGGDLVPGTTNTGLKGGGGYGGGLFESDPGTTLLNQIIVTGNHAQGGDGHDTPDASGEIAGGGSGGGIGIQSTKSTAAEVTITNAIVGGNFSQAGNNYAGQTNQNPNSSGMIGAGSGGGGGIYISNLPVTMNFVTVADNTIDQDGSGEIGQGIVVNVLPTQQLTNPAPTIIENSIIAEHNSPSSIVPALYVNTGAQVDLTDVLFAHNYSDTNGISGDNISGYNPAWSTTQTAGFVSPSTNDFHLSPSSIVLQYPVQNPGDQYDVYGNTRSDTTLVGAQGESFLYTATSAFVPDAQQHLWENNPKFNPTAGTNLNAQWLETSSGTFTAISSTQNIDGDQVAFAIKNDGTLWENNPQFDPAAGQNLSAQWLEVSPGSFTAISATRNANGDQVVYAIRSDGTLWENNLQFNPTDSATDLNGHWAEVSPGSFTAISATRNSDGNPVVYAILSGGTLWENNPQFNPTDPNMNDHWAEVSPGSFTAISATRNSDGNPVVYAILSGGTLWENNPQFNPTDPNMNDHWVELSTLTFTTISSTQDGNNNPVVYAIKSDGTLWEYNPTNQWLEVSPGTFTAISATRNTDGNQVVYAVLNDGTVWENNPQFNPSAGTDLNAQWLKVSSGSFTAVSAT
ncbi:hypothetical protein [Fimbriiglobus ruber]|nr:hypothetical protein [Fimbriiglobus ruber]